MFEPVCDWLVSCCLSDVTVELPLMLMHPKPEGNVWKQTFHVLPNQVNFVIYIFFFKLLSYVNLPFDFSRIKMAIIGVSRKQHEVSQKLTLEVSS